MNAQQFIKKFEKLSGARSPTVDQPVKIASHNAMITLLLRKEDCSLYVEIVHGDYAYFYNFGNNKDTLYAGSKTPLEIEVVSDMVERMEAMFNGTPFPDKVTVELDLPEDILLELALGAHAKNITFNEYVAELIQTFVDKCID